MVYFGMIYSYKKLCVVLFFPFLTLLVGQECELYVSVEQDDQGIDRNRLNAPKIK